MAYADQVERDYATFVKASPQWPTEKRPKPNSSGEPRSDEFKAASEMDDLDENS